MLRPLHRRDLPGHLAAEVGEYLFEFRNRDRWDAAIPEPAILVHRLVDGRSYLEPGGEGRPDLVVGGEWGLHRAGIPALVESRLVVSAIDAAGDTATLSLVHPFGELPPRTHGGDHGTPDPPELDLGSLGLPAFERPA